MYGCITTGIFAHLLRGRVGLIEMGNPTNENDMNDSKNNRKKWLHLRLSEDEHKKIHKGFSSSTSKKMSDYARHILLDKPVTIYTRNKSFDEFAAEMVLLRNELAAIGNNLNQTVKRLHTMTDCEQIRSWALQNEKNKEQFFQKTDEINKKIKSISEQWLHG